MIERLLPVQWTETRTQRRAICLDLSSALVSTQYSHSNSRPRNIIDVQQKLYEIHDDGADIVMSTSTHWNEW